MACLSHLLHISIHGGYISSKFREGSSLTPLLATQASQLRGRCSLKRTAWLWMLWIALVTQELAFHVSDFSQGALMLIHFTLLTHLFFFRLFFFMHSYIYMYGGVDFGCHCAVSERLYWRKTFHLISLTHSSKYTRCCVWVTVLLNLLPALSGQMAWMLGIIRGAT